MKWDARKSVRVSFERGYDVNIIAIDGLATVMDDARRLRHRCKVSRPSIDRRTSDQGVLPGLGANRTCLQALRIDLSQWR
jgi:hypothetical protein